MNQKTQNKRIAMIIASQEFRDEECFETKAILEKQGFKLTLFSDKKGLALGVLGGEIEVEKTLEELDVSNFDALLFVGGLGAIKFLDNNLSYRAIREANDKNKLIVAICIAPVILAHAGVLKDKKATVWSDALNKSAIKIIEEAGAVYVNQASVVDGNIVTANGPEAILDFCENIIKVM